MEENFDCSVANAVGLQSVILKCKELHTIALLTLDIFYLVISNSENMKHLCNNINNFSQRLSENETCPWITLMIYAGPHMLTARMLEDLVVIFTAGRRLPSGFAIRGLKGKAHIGNKDYDRMLVASAESCRVCAILCSYQLQRRLIKDNRTKMWEYLLSSIVHKDVIRSGYSMTALIQELMTNPNLLLSSKEVNNLLDAFKMYLSTFQKSYNLLGASRKKLKVAKNKMLRARYAFKEQLLEIAKTDDENQLDVPLEYFLNDNARLKKLYQNRQGAVATKEAMDLLFQKSCDAVEGKFVSLRYMSMLLALALSNYFALEMDTNVMCYPVDLTQPIPLNSATLSPAIRRKIFGAKLSPTGMAVPFDEDLYRSESSAIVERLLNDFSWEKLYLFSRLEQIVSQVTCTRVLAATCCKISDSLQMQMSSWLKSAVLELVECERWYPVREEIVQKIQTKKLDDSFEDCVVDLDEVPVVQFVSRPLQLTVSTATALCYWATRGNGRMIDECLSWNVNDKHDSEQSDNDFDGSGCGYGSQDSQSESSPRKNPLIASIISKLSDASELVMDVNAYYSRQNPLLMIAAMSLRVLDDHEDNDSDVSSDESGGDSDDEEDHGATGLLKRFLRDEDALLILKRLCRAIEEEEEDANFHKSLYGLVTSTHNSSRYLQLNIEEYVTFSLNFSLHGPSEMLDFRPGIHPLHFVSSLLQETSAATKEAQDILCTEISSDSLKNILKCCEGFCGVSVTVVDLVASSAAMELLAVLIGSSLPPYIHLSELRSHEHLMSSIRSHESLALLSGWKFFHAHTQFCRQIVNALVENMYAPSPHMFAVFGPNGLPMLSRMLKLLAAISFFDDLYIKELMEHIFATVEKKRALWKDCTALTEGAAWMAPLVKGILGEVSDLASISLYKVNYAEEYPWCSMTDEDYQKYGNSLKRSCLDIRRDSALLLSVLCMSNKALCNHLASNFSIVVPTLSNALSARDYSLSQSVLRIATCVVMNAKELTAAGLSRLVPNTSQTAYFRILFANETNTFELACSLLSNVSTDFWGESNLTAKYRAERAEYDDLLHQEDIAKQALKLKEDLEKKQAETQAGKETSASEDTRKLLQTSRSASEEQKLMPLLSASARKDSLTDITSSEKNNDNSLAHELPAINSEITMSADVETETKTETETEIGTSAGAGVAGAARAAQTPRSLASRSHSGRASEDNKLRSRDANDSECQSKATSIRTTSSNDLKDSVADSASLYDENDDETRCLSSALSMRTHISCDCEEWNNTFIHLTARRARNYLLCLLEFFTEFCDNREELQNKLLEACPTIFNLLCQFLLSNDRSFITSRSHQTGVNDVLRYSFVHIGAIGGISIAIKNLGKRNEKNCRLAIEGGHLLGAIIRCLNMAYELSDMRLGLCIVRAIEQLIMRNLDAWTYIKTTGGIEGMLQLCHMGNNAIRILACTDLIGELTSPDRKRVFHVASEISRCNGLYTILLMLQCPDSNVQTSALSLLRNELTHETNFRNNLMDEKVLTEVIFLLYSPEPKVVRIICDIFLILGNHDQKLLKEAIENLQSVVRVGFRNSDCRHSFVREKSRQGGGLSVFGRLVDIANGRVSVDSVSSVGIGGGKFDVNNKIAEWSKESNVNYTSFALSNDESHNDPRLIKEVVSLANLASSVIACLTDYDESVWPDGAAPLRHTMKKSGILPTIYTADA